MKNRIIFFLYPGFELMDIAGPISVFSCTESRNFFEYDLKFLSPTGGCQQSRNQISVRTEPISDLNLSKNDTVFITGGNFDGINQALDDKTTRQWIKEAARNSYRFATIGSGAILTCQVIDLNKLTLATHWSCFNWFKQNQPGIHLMEDSLYHIDNWFWSSAGGTGAIDLALLMLKEDFGEPVMKEVAKRHLVYHHRNPDTPQISQLLSAQTSSSERFSELLEWLENHLDEKVSLDTLSDKMAMSKRSVNRYFLKKIGDPPIKYIESIRMNHAKILIEQGLPIKTVARKLGYKTESSFCIAFRKFYKGTAKDFREKP